MSGMGEGGVSPVFDAESKFTKIQNSQWLFMGEGGQPPVFDA